MAFGNFGSAGGGMMGALSSGNDSQIVEPSLERIQTEALGFLAINGDAKVQLTDKWDNLPAPTASLLTIASRKGLVAAAGPDGISIATTELVRKAFEGEKQGDSHVRPFTPQFKLPMSMRVSQIAFTPDEQYLLLSAETGGGLAVYNVDALSQGSTKPEFELSTEGQTLRGLIPNPMADKAEFVAIVTNDGNLLMANLKERSFVNGANGPILKAQVSCAAWSSKGKQLVAGSADGSVYQMTPDGQEKAHIPKPPGMGDFHVASISWLENDVFLTVHNDTSGKDLSKFTIITRHAPKGETPKFAYRSLEHPVEGFAQKVPHHAILRLRDFPPDLQDVLFVASTQVENIGLLTRSKKPLSNEVAADKITNVFTTTELMEDSSRASLPVDEEFNDTFFIGAALDLSSKEKVSRPITADPELKESAGPLPALWVLNNVGVLCAWWLVYNDSIRQGTTYSELGGGQSASAPAMSAPAAAPTPSAFAASPAPAAAPAFGGASALGAKASPWGSSTAAAPAAPAFGQSSFGTAPVVSSPAFGAPSFGTPSMGGMGAKSASPAFGQATTMGLGMRTSAWGSAGGQKTAFGQPSLGGSATPAANPFASAGQSKASPFASAAPSGGGFSSFANKGGFASLGAGTENKGGFAALGSGTQGTSPFGASKPADGASPFGSSNPAQGASPFGSSKPFGTNDAAKPTSPFASDATKTGTGPFGAGAPFGGTSSQPAKVGAFGAPSTPFVLGSTFKQDPVSANDNEMSVEEARSKTSMFGSGFGLSLGDTPKAAKDEAMDSTTPKNTPAPSKLFGGSTGGSLFGFNKTAQTPQPGSNDQGNEPLPPDTMSRTAYPLGESSSSSGSSAFTPDRISKTNQLLADTPVAKSDTPAAAPKSVEVDDAPLPPMPTAKERTKLSNLPALPTEKADDAPLPPMPSAKERTTLAKQPALPTPTPADDAPLPPMPSAKERTKLANTPALPNEPPKAMPALPSSSTPNPFAKPPVAPAKPANPFSVMSQPNVSDPKTNPFAKLPPPPAEPSSDEFSGSEDGEFEEEPEEGEEGEGEEADDEEGDEDSAENASLPPSEGSGTDVAEDITRENPAPAIGTTPGYSPESSFQGMAGSTFSVTSRPAEPEKLFGEIGRPPQQFYPPTRTSPRSPSPVRKPLPQAVPAASVPSRVFRQDSQRSVSAPGMASQILGDRRQAQPSRLGQSTTPRAPPVRDVNVEEQWRNEAKKQAEESRNLVDDEYEFVERQLDEPIEPTLQMAECVFKEGEEPEGNSSIATQCEVVYRDINRMIQACKINSRSLKSFIAGHSGEGRQAHQPESKEDLELADDWILCDIATCDKILTQDLAAELADSRISDVEQFNTAIDALNKELARVKALHKDVKKMVEARSHPDQVAAAKSTPLSAEQAAQQNDLRRGFTQLCKDLAEAEQALVLLKTKLVSAGGSTGRSGPAPTVEAVMRTITKMTSMAEKRSGDVDMLETQMRKLGWRPDPEVENQRERDVSPATPQKRASVYAPGSTMRTLASSMASMGIHSSPARGTPPRKKMTHFTDKEKTEVRARKTGRQRTVAELKKALAENGPVVVPFEEK